MRVVRSEKKHRWERKSERRHGRIFLTIVFWVKEGGKGKQRKREQDRGWRKTIIRGAPVFPRLGHGCVATPRASCVDVAAAAQANQN